MAKPVHRSHFPLLLLLFFSIQRTNQQQPSQSQTLLQTLQLLHYPKALSAINTSTDFCNTEPNPSLAIICYEDNITQLHVIGPNGSPPLPQNFSVDSVFDSLVGFSSLKVLSLVSLGLWGSLPSSIGQLFSLEILNVTSNYLSGQIPVEVFGLSNLQTFILDHNKFTGQVPDWLGSLPILTVLSLRNNSFNGSLPNSISRLQSLRILVLSANYFSGEMPDLHKLTNLQVLDLEGNHFGPHFPIMHNKLVRLVLRQNRFQLGIPDELGSYYQLQELDISFNGFVGPFLPSILSLPSIKYLNIAGNKFTGLLSQNMTCNTELAFVDLSSNLLTGNLPSCLKMDLDTKRKVVSYARNCLSNEVQEQYASNFCHNEALAVKILPHNQEIKRPQAKAVLGSSIVGGFVGGIAIVGVVLLVIRRLYQKGNARKSSTRLIMESVSTINTAKLLSDARYISQTMKLGASLPAYRTFTLEELKEATKGFAASNSMGKGDASYSQIDRGKLADGTLVSLRSLTMRKKHSPQSYTHLIELISKLRHSHLVSALGHCFETWPNDSSLGRLYLVFEFVPDWSLRSCISGLEEGMERQKLTWTQRIAAAIGVAKGMQFLHTGIVPGLFSNNLKITDVFLGDNFHAKISVYNLPVLAENHEIVHAGFSSRKLKGRIWARGKQEDKNDVYDIGVILLEIITGRQVMSYNEVNVAKDLLQASLTKGDTAQKSIVDQVALKDCSGESLKTVIEICLRCLSNEATDRPTVEDVLWNLKFAAQLQDSWKIDSQQNPESALSFS